MSYPTRGRGRSVPKWTNVYALWLGRGPPRLDSGRPARLVEVDERINSKAHLATAIGMEAIARHGRRVRFLSTVELVNQLEVEKAAGRQGLALPPARQALRDHQCGTKHQPELHRVVGHLRRR